MCVSVCVGGCVSMCVHVRVCEGFIDFQGLSILLLVSYSIAYPLATVVNKKFNRIWDWQSLSNSC